MDILNPPEVYIKYRCAVHGLSGQELILAQERFYKKQPESRTEICQFFNRLEEERNNNNLPFERIEVRDSDRKRHGHVVKMMIYDIEYWIEGGNIKKRKTYLANQGELAIQEVKQRPSIDRKSQAAGDYESEVPF